MTEERSVERSVERSADSRLREIKGFDPDRHLRNREEVIRAGLRMIAEKLTIETWGNISLRDKESGLIYLTPSGMPYDSITPEDVAVMDSEENVLDGVRKPTIEAGLHVRIYNKRPDVNAIVHTHPVDSQVFAMLNMGIPPVNDEMAQVLGGGVPCAPYGLPGSEDLAEKVSETIGSSMACLLANHGAVCLGRDMNGAFRTGTVLEMTARIYYKALCIGTPVPIKDEYVEKMYKAAFSYFRQEG